MRNIVTPSGFFGNRSFSLNNHRPFIDTDGLSKIIGADGKKIPTAMNAALSYDDWKDIDRTVVKAVMNRLVGIADLVSAGLVYKLGSVGQTVSVYQRQSDITGAQVSMSGVVRSNKDAPKFSNKSIPVPVVHKEFSFDFRTLEASRANGNSLDTSTAELAGVSVAEASEDILFAGSPIQVDGESIFGYLTHPDRNTVAMGSAWTALTGAQILATVQLALTALRTDKHFGPYTVYIPAAYEGRLDEDYAPGTSDTRTVRQRIMALEGVKNIRTADRLSGNNVVVVQLTREVVDIAIAQDVTTIQWQNQGGLEFEYKAMAVWVPRVKSRYDGQSGVAVIAL